jgi:mannosyltransferase
VTTQSAAPVRARRRLASAALLAIAAPTLLSLVLSVATVGRRDLWRDEMATWEFSRLSFPDLGRAVQNVDAVLAPYYALMHAWQWIFPQAVALRVPSLLAAAATVAVVAATAARLWNRWAGLVAGAALALNGSFAATAVSARPYALATLGCAVATYLLVRARSDPSSTRLWAWYAISCSLAISLQFFAVLTLAAHGLIAIVWFGRDAAARRRAGTALAAVSVVAIGVAIASTSQQGQLLWAQPQSAGDAMHILTSASGQLHPWHGWLLLVAGAVSLPAAIRARDTGWLLGPSLLLMPAGCLFVLSGAWHPAFVERYLVAAPIGAALVVGNAVGALHGRRPAAAVAAVAITAVFAAGLPALRADFSASSVDDFPGLIALVEQHAAPGDLVVVGQDYASGGIAAGFAYYGDDASFERDVVAGLPDGSPTLYPRDPTGSATSVGSPHGRTWLISLVRWWVGERYPYGYRLLEQRGCVRDTSQPELRTHGYGLLLMRCA